MSEIYNSDSVVFGEYKNGSQSFICATPHADALSTFLMTSRERERRNFHHHWQFLLWSRFSIMYSRMFCFCFGTQRSSHILYVITCQSQYMGSVLGLYTAKSHLTSMHTNTLLPTCYSEWNIELINDSSQLQDLMEWLMLSNKSVWHTQKFVTFISISNVNFQKYFRDDVKWNKVDVKQVSRQHRTSYSWVHHSTNSWSPITIFCKI